RGDVPDHGTADGAVNITYETLEDLVQSFHDHADEIPVHRIQVHRDHDDARRRLGRLESFPERRLDFRP
ncbi:hypothetical protein Tco_1287593, partial [Tanacetum coccineum]